MKPTGQLITGPVGEELVFTRNLPHAVDTVWSHIVDSGNLGTWYGTWTGDPGSGTVTLSTLAAPDSPAEVSIQHCEAPTALVASLDAPTGSWKLTVQLFDSGGETELELRQRLNGLSHRSGELGPEWEYHLDRLALALDGGDVDTLDRAEYAQLSGHYG